MNKSNKLNDSQLAALVTAVRTSVTAGRSPNVSHLAELLGVSVPTIGRKLGDWHKEGKLNFSDKNGGLNGHTHHRFFGEVFAR